MKVVTIKFDERSNKYAYLTDIEDIAVGDTVVVESPYSGYTCVTVVAVDDSAEAVTKATKWVVCKVDTAAYTARIEREKKRAVITAKLRKLKSDMLEANQFAALAAESPEAAKLVEELKKL